MKKLLQKISIFLLFSILIYSCTSSEQISNKQTIKKSRNGATYVMHKKKQVKVVKSITPHSHNNKSLSKILNNEYNNNEELQREKASKIKIIKLNISETLVKEIINYPLNNNNPIIRDSTLTIPEDTTKKYDLIVPMDGDDIKAKVIEVGTDFIKYKKANYLDGPLYTISKSEIIMIKYANGDKETFLEYSKNETVEVKKDKIKKRSLALNTLGTFFSIFGWGMLYISGIALIPELALVGLVLGVMGFIFSFISIFIISAKHEEYKGLGFAILFSIFGALLLLSIAAAL